MLDGEDPRSRPALGVADERQEVEAVLEQQSASAVLGGSPASAELSGGQQQRVFIARALLSRRRCCCWTSPRQASTCAPATSVLHLLADLNADGLAVVLTTHDLNGIASHLPHLVCLNTETIAEGPPRLVMTSEILERTYGAPMDVLEHGGMQVVVGPLRRQRPCPSVGPPRHDLAPAPRAVSGSRSSATA